MRWVFLVLLYGVAKGIRDAVKKKALRQNTVMEILFVYTFLAFLFCIPEAPKAFTDFPPKYYILIAFKSFVIFIAWILSFYAIDHVPISIYGVLDLSRIIFSTLFGIIVLDEQVTVFSTLGFFFVLAGLVILQLYPVIKQKHSGSLDTYEDERVNKRFLAMILVSCLLNAVSGCLDKVYTKEINSSQLQFWYMLYLVIFYGLYFLVKKLKISSTVWKNGWIWLLSILFYVADRALFIANEDPSSKLMIMTLIKQSACIVSILAGKFIFKEKHIGYKLFCAGVVLLGIFFGSMG